MATVTTRDRVLTTALRLFRERGYEATTMRLIATEAGVATGNAYYWFPSKGHLVQELYRTVVTEHSARARETLRPGTSLSTRLAATLHAGLDAFEPYHAFGSEFVAIALRPGSGASPFSDASREPRAVSLELFREVVDGARPAAPRALREDLPELLWLAQLGVLLRWVHDESAERRRTRQLVDHGAVLVGRLVRLAALPVLRSAVDDVLALARLVRA